MLLHLESVLDDVGLRDAQRLAATITFEDGAASAGYRARRVKHNEQSVTSAEHRQL